MRLHAGVWIEMLEDIESPSGPSFKKGERLLVIKRPVVGGMRDWYLVAPESNLWADGWVRKDCVRVLTPLETLAKVTR